MLIMEIEKTFTIKQVAEMLQMSERTIQRWIRGERQGETLRAIELPGRGPHGVEYRIPISALREQGFTIEDTGE